MAQLALVGWVIVIGCVTLIVGMALSLVIGVVTIAIERKRNKWLS